MVQKLDGHDLDVLRVGRNARDTEIVVPNRRDNTGDMGPVTINVVVPGIAVVVGKIDSKYVVDPAVPVVINGVTFGRKARTGFWSRGRV
jgi:hypothetical protein